LYRCLKCHKFSAKYDYDNKCYICTNPECKFVEKLSKRKHQCESCWKEFEYWTWFDPSNCPHCYRSFIE